MQITKTGTVRIWGDWFGRPWDNIHTVESADYDETKNLLIINFWDGERCTIYNPQNVVNDSNEFSVAKATKIIWEWYYYGRERTFENLCQRIYTFRDNEEVVAEYLGAMQRGTKYLNPKDHLAFEICR